MAMDVEEGAVGEEAEVVPRLTVLEEEVEAGLRPSPKVPVGPR